MCRKADPKLFDYKEGKLLENVLVLVPADLRAEYEDVVEFQKDKYDKWALAADDVIFDGYKLEVAGKQTAEPEVPPRDVGDPAPTKSATRKARVKANRPGKPKCSAAAPKASSSGVKRVLQDISDIHENVAPSTGRERQVSRRLKDCVLG